MVKKKLSLCALLILCMAVALCACNINNKDNDNTTAEGTAISNLADNEQYYGTTFGQGSVTDIYVEISDEDWQDILANASAEEYHSANITVNGTKLENVGFRTKGFSSLTSVVNSESDRYGFKVKTDKYVKGQTLNGLDMFVLNASFADPSYMREYLTYSASNYLGCITPFVSYTNLYINGELFGFYMCIESYDDSFVERYTDSEDTVLYKAESENCTLATTDDGSGFDIQYGKDENYTNIKELVSVLNNTTESNKSELEAILDIDSVLKALAVNSVMANYDSYSGSKAHNYYLLYSDGKFSYIGWDYNMSIGGFSADNGASVTADITKALYGVDASRRPLIEKLLAIEEYNARYLAYVNDLIEYFSDFETMVSNISSEIRDYVSADPSAFYTVEQFDANITASDTDLSQVQSRGGFGGEGMTMPDMSNMENGENMFGEKGMGMGGMISQNAVSIVDYITQRINNIKTQLGQ